MHRRPWAASQMTICGITRARPKRRIQPLRCLTAADRALTFTPREADLVAADPNTQRQIRNLDDMIHSSRRNVDNLKQQIKLLQRQESDAKRLPNSSREVSKIQN